MTALPPEIADRQHVTLGYPHLIYSGQRFDEDETLMSWWAHIQMTVADVEDPDEEKGMTLNVGHLQLWTAPIDGQLADQLDWVSTDLSAYLAVITPTGISDGIEKQFPDVCTSDSVLILDRAYIRPALRGHDIGAWAASRAIADLTSGGISHLVLAYPAPTQKRPGVTRKVAVKQLAQHWRKVGLQPLRGDARDLVGACGAEIAMDNARKALDEVGRIEVVVAVSDLTADDEQPI